jgi:hypothetical protein
MKEPRPTCAICGARPPARHGWFLVRSEGGRDHISVLRWDSRRAAEPGMHSVCGADHARELVARWVFSGTLCCAAQGARWHLDSPTPSVPAQGTAADDLDPRDLDLSPLDSTAPETLLSILDAVEAALHDKWEEFDHDDHEVLLYDA